MRSRRQGFEPGDDTTLFEQLPCSCLVVGSDGVVQSANAHAAALLATDRDALVGAERALRRSEERFHAAFTHGTAGTALLDRCGRILEANDALQRLVGATGQQLIG